MYIVLVLRQPARYHVFNMSFLVKCAGMFTAYIAVLIGILSFGTKKALRAQYSQTAVQNYALMLNADGLSLVAGNIVSVVPWKMIRRIVDIRDVMFIHAIPWQQTIPSYAFHSAGDAKAFVATAKALKRRKPVPVHDWSGYTGIVATREGSWPPAIGSEN